MATRSAGDMPRPMGDRDRTSATSAWWWVVAIIVIAFIIWGFSWGWGGRRAAAPVNNAVPANQAAPAGNAPANAPANR